MAILMKQGGVWKDTTDSWIKVNGVWRQTIATLIKNGGTWADTSRLSDTKLDYDMTIAKEADGSRYLVEKNDTTLHKAPLQSGHSVALSGDGKIEVPINHDGSLDYKYQSDFSNNINGWYESVKAPAHIIASFRNKHSKLEIHNQTLSGYYYVGVPLTTPLNAGEEVTIIIDFKTLGGVTNIVAHPTTSGSGADGGVIVGTTSTTGIQKFKITPAVTMNYISIFVGTV